MASSTSIGTLYYQVVLYRSVLSFDMTGTNAERWETFLHWALGSPAVFGFCDTSRYIMSYNDVGRL